MPYMPNMRIGIVLPLLSLWTWFSCSPSFASAFQASPAASPQDKNTSQQERETLQASALAYQQVVALSDVLTYTVTTPNAVLPPKTQKVNLGSRPQVALVDPLIEAVALDGSLFVTKSDAPGKYVVRPRRSARCGRRRAGLASGTLADRHAAWKGHRRLVDCTKVQTAVNTCSSHPTQPLHRLTTLRLTCGCCGLAHPGQTSPTDTRRSKPVTGDFSNGFAPA
jgi:hypothetical protein